MKTKGLGKLLILGLILTSLVSCKEEEFYEKEFIDTLSDQYERENLPDDVAEAAWDDPADNPDQVTDTGSNGGGSDDGSTDNGGSNGGGSDDGSTDNGGSTPPPVLEEVADLFAQNANGSKMDILWVIDNSGSMGDEQRALGENFSAFIKEFINKDIDFQMAVTTTDTSRNNAGQAYKESLEKLTSAKLKADKDQFMSDFADHVKVGTRGSGYEKGIQASEVFTNRFSNSWLRKDAYLTIVYVSDEEDQSQKNVPDHLKQIQKWKDNNGLIKAYSIVDMVPTRRSGAISRGYERYNEMSELTGGKVASIKSNFHTTLLDMGEVIANLVEQFPLSKAPHNSADVKVYVDDIQVTEWTYDKDSNSIKFNSDSIPAAGAKIEIKYDVEK